MKIHGNLSCVDLNSKLLDSYDLFLSSAGFEDRTLAGLERLNGLTKFKKSIINLFKPDDLELYERNKNNLEKMKVILSNISNDQIIIDHKPHDSIPFTQILSNYLQGVETILIDITSFTRLFLYSILDTCTKNQIKVHILYSEPEDYTMNLSQGLEDIVILPTNPGIPDQSKKVLMVLFLGWESRRLGSVVEEWEPDKLITIAEYSDDEKREYWNSTAIRQCLDLIEKSDFFRVPALKPRETLVKLEQIYEKFGSEYDICLVNGGPKIQCLAFSEFALFHPEVQILYPKPYKWQQSLPDDDKTLPTSNGKGKSYMFSYPIQPILEKSIQIN